MKISVIIPTKNRPNSLMNAILSITNQTVPPFEIIIVDQSPKKIKIKKIFNFKKTKPKIKFLHQPLLNGLTAARNFGIKYAKGEIIQFLDDDSKIEKKYILKLKALFHRKNIDGLAGKIIESKNRKHPLAKIFQKLFFFGELRQIREEWYNKNNAGEIITNTLPGVAAYRKKVFKNYKFDETMTGSCIGEDLDFSYRASKRHKFILTPEIKIYHKPDSNERYKDEEQTFKKIKFYQYHMKKNIKQTTFNRVCFYWLNIGLFFHTLISLRPAKVHGLLRAWFSG